MDMNMSRDNFIKKKFEEDNYISEQANDVFKKFQNSISNSKVTNQMYNRISNQESSHIDSQLNSQINNQNNNRFSSHVNNFASSQSNNTKNEYNNPEIIFYRRMNRFLSVAAVFLCAIIVGTGTIIYNRKNKVENIDIVTKSTSVRNEELKFSSEQVTKFHENDLIKVSLIGSRDVAIQLKQAFIELYDLNLSPYKQYKVNNISKDVKDVFVGNIVSDKTPYVMLLMDDETVEYIQILEDDFSSESRYEFNFESKGRINGLYNVVAFEQSSRYYSYSSDVYYYINAIKEDGQKREIDIGYYNGWDSNTTNVFDELNKKYIDKYEQEQQKRIQKEKEKKTSLKDSFKVTYETIGVRNITVGGASFVCNEYVPHITGISSQAANNIETYLNNWYKEVWEDIDSQTEDEYIYEMLKNMNENSINNPNYAIGDIGFTQSYEIIYINDKVVTFKHILQGGLGGVGWDSESGVSFNLSTGEKIDIEDIVTSKKDYIDVCKNYTMRQLKADERFEEVAEMHGNDYEIIVNEAIEKMDGYFTKDGIVCIEIPKYAIASGASGEFRYVIPYEVIRDYINSDYVF